MYDFGTGYSAFRHSQGKTSFFFFEQSVTRYRLGVYTYRLLLRGSLSVITPRKPISPPIQSYKPTDRSVGSMCHFLPWSATLPSTTSSTYISNYIRCLLLSKNDCVFDKSSERYRGSGEGNRIETGCSIHLFTQDSDVHH